MTGAVLVCVRSAWQTGQMGKDLGFLTCQLRTQLFSPTLDQVEFCTMAVEFGLVMKRHAGPFQPVVGFLERHCGWRPRRPLRGRRMFPGTGARRVDWRC